MSQGKITFNTKFRRFSDHNTEDNILVMLMNHENIMWMIPPQKRKKKEILLHEQS